MTIVALISLAVFSFAYTASADGCNNDGERVVQHVFEKADRDENGSLTRDEYEGAGLQSFGLSFEESDLDGDGETSAAEYLEIYQQIHNRDDRGEA